MSKRKTLIQTELKGIVGRVESKRLQAAKFRFDQLPSATCSSEEWVMHENERQVSEKIKPLLHQDDYSIILPTLVDLYQSHGPNSFWLGVLSHVDLCLWEFCLTRFELTILKQRIRVLVACLKQHIDLAGDEHFNEWYKRALQLWLYPSFPDWVGYLVVYSDNSAYTRHHLLILQFLEGGIRKFRFPISLLMRMMPNILSTIRPRMLSFDIEQWQLLINLEDEECLKWAFLHNMHYPNVMWKGRQILTTVENCFSEEDIFKARLWIRLLHGSTYHCLSQLKSTVILSKIESEKDTKEIAAMHRPKTSLILPAEPETKEEKRIRVRKQLLDRGLPCNELFHQWQSYPKELAIELYWMGVRSSTHSLLMRDLRKHTFSIVKAALTSSFGVKEIVNAIFVALPQTRVMDPKQAKQVRTSGDEPPAAE